MPRTLEPPRQLIGGMVRVTHDRDTAGVLRVVITVYDGQRGSDIWLRQDQSLVECLSRLGLERDSIPDDVGERGLQLYGKIYSDAFAEAKALYCSHSRTIEMADQYFVDLVACLEKRCADHNTMAAPDMSFTATSGSRYVRVTGLGLTVHVRLEHPKERAERALSVYFQTSPRDVGSERVNVPTPLITSNGRLVWIMEGNEIRPDELAASILKVAAGS